LVIDELYQWVEENKLYLHHWFFSTDLTFYIKGGRISKTAGFIGSVMGICPFLNVNSEGRLILREKVRPRKKVIRKIVEKMEQNARDGLDYSEKCFMCHSLCMEDAQAVASLVEEKFKNLNGNVEIFPIGTTIGSHTGPGTVALFFWGGKREQ
jgi:DegV family protein with EDD domain